MCWGRRSAREGLAWHPSSLIFPVVLCVAFITLVREAERCFCAAVNLVFVTCKNHTLQRALGDSEGGRGHGHFYQISPTQGDFCYWDLQLDGFPFPLADIAIALKEALVAYSSTSFLVGRNSVLAMKNLSASLECCIY